MPEAINPYAPPVEVNEVAEDPDVVALRRLGGPAIGLIVLAAMTAPYIIIVPFLPIVYLIRVFAHDSPKLVEILGALAISIATISNCVILVGAWNMRRGTNYKLAYATAVLSCIPLLTASGHLGIPFGIWALIVLRRKDVKAAFASKANRSEGAAIHGG